MPRPRKQPEPPADPPEPASETSPGATTGTAEYYRQQLDELDTLNRKALAELKSGGKLPIGYNSLRQGIIATAKFRGIDERSLMDNRSEGDKARDAAEELIETEGRGIFNQLDPVLDALEAGMKRAVEGHEQIIQEKREAVEQAAWRAGAGKKWLNRLERVRRLREMARSPVPKVTWSGEAPPPRMHPAWEASHTARFMIYVGRSDLPMATEAERIFDIAPHLCKVGVDIWQAKERVAYYAKGDKAHPSGGVKRGVTRCSGIFVIMPPRHGKTAFAAFTVALWICLDPYEQILMNHAVDEQIQKNLAYIQSMFNKDEALGKRLLSLFPLELTRKDNNSSKMRLKLRERTRQPTIEAAGVAGAVGGSGATKQWWDDPVDKKEVDQPAERARKFERLTQVWLPRMMAGSGARSFLLVTATLWHDEDAVTKMVKQAQAGESDYAVSIQGVGGPKTAPPFFHIWDLYPPGRLKQLYKDMRDPYGWASQYMADPRPEDLRIIRRLRYYLASLGDFENPTAEHRALLRKHQDFIEAFGTQFHVSADPSATAKSDADRAGLIWAAIGDLLVTEKQDGHTLEKRTRRIRLLAAEQIHAGQVDLVEHIIGKASQWRMDRIHVETVSGYMATAEMLMRRFDLSTDQVVCHQVANMNKGQRLKAVSPMLDDSLTDQGLPGAVFEFPGELDEEGNLVPLKGTEWLSHQILNFPTAEKGGLDAVTQLCRALQGECSAGEGEVSTIIMDAYEDHSGRPRRFAERDRLFKERRGRGTSVVKEETQWMHRSR